MGRVVIDITKMSAAELEDLKMQIDVEIVTRKEKEKRDLRAEMLRKVADTGFRLANIRVAT